ncbi:MAG TPA: TetR/AcrR family transcriptional regulator [Edaphobacter sp.]|uniref:TetR/AcrR family transcriptional regulator n=1 Tax=Edaphobacter sp. TaxID=1934404 RepID=UPI002B828380|nr:TetR/AcrR family transcriptional regulator [Edaphobacter sp.]HUZ93645.1 TetR/AcrR family transcriptional regulator [Edaphobacter sp.]
MSKGEETRLRIVAEAAPLFNQRGYEGCSMQDIMDATGLEKGGIYRHFESKEELAAEAFDFAWAIAFSKRRQNLDSFPNPVDRLKQHIANFVSRSSFPGGCPLLNTAVDSDNGNPVLREKVRKALRGWQSLLQDILKEGIQDGSIRADVDVNQVSSLIIGGLEGGMLISRIERNDQGLRAALEHLDSYLESQVRKTSKAPSKNR